MDRLEDSDSSAAGAEREETALPRDVYALLAQANLLRVRGHWEQAAQGCMAALRPAPDSASANSLLGDIYENQGRYDDAAQWYRMALDANPDSPADRLKLDRLLRRDEQLKERNSADRAPAAEAPRPTRDPESVLRYGAIFAALGLVLIVACAFMVAHRGHAFSIGGEAVVKSTPVIVPPLAGALPADPDAAAVRAPSEQSVLAALQGSRDLSEQGIAVYDVQADPRSGGLAVTFGFAATPGLTQAQVAHEALQVLVAAASAGQSPQAWTARCLLMTPAGNAAATDGTPTLVFVGDVSRLTLQAAASAGRALSDTQAEAAFTNVWWSSTADIRT